MSERRNWSRPAACGAALLLLVAVLAGCDLLGPRAIYETASIQVLVAGGGSAASRAIAQTASPDQIDRIFLSVSGENRFGVFQDPLATAELSGSGSSWSATVDGLPLGPPLTFQLQAFDAAGTLIYTGSTTTVLSSSNLTVAIVLTPYDDGVTQIAFPVIRQIIRPAEIIQGTGAEISLTLEGSSTETLTVQISTGGGGFAPPSPIGVPLSSGEATLELVYSAPGTPQSYVHTVRAENEQGNSVERQFSTVVVWETASGLITIGGVAPAVTGLGLSLQGSDLLMTAEVSDDGPLAELLYAWSFDGGLSFTDGTTNPAVLLGYDETVSGTVTLTVTDSDTSSDPDGLSTTVSFLLPAGLFPDEVVQEPPGGPSPGELTKLTPSDGVADEQFGASVSISGDAAIVGAPYDDDMGTDSGSAYLFRWNGSAWAEEAKLAATDGAAIDRLGSSVSISGDTAIVGVPYDDDAGDGSGSAYLFRRSGSSWIQEAKLAASDAEQGVCFGSSVSISGDVVIVGVYRDDSFAGSAYLFRRSGSAWIQEAKLTASDAAVDDRFGYSVSISGDTAVVGAPFDDDAGTSSGSAYLFRWSGGSTWVQEAKLIASDGAEEDLFGCTVAIAGGAAVVGAKADDDAGFTSGSAYVFRWNGSAWAQEAKLTASDGENYAAFGLSLSISGDTAIVGAQSGGSGGTGSGSAYVFRWNGVDWVEELKLTAPDSEAYDRFGFSASISGDTAIVGAYGDAPAGSAYVVRLY